ncbi:hypothetical protein BV25DRAFT_1820066 [Artomyces pyxidatus]|uniref:Uncharacterized protein n=1 Tax=Artomyces pyxidatus TaxID=48021 RepID=A0ACB8TEV7_9AGAM|nr:hypothetical protein BV25DRAFT_1820066 [Artomyces pyxidatus]
MSLSPPPTPSSSRLPPTDLAPPSPSPTSSPASSPASSPQTPSRLPLSLLPLLHKLRTRTSPPPLPTIISSSGTVPLTHKALRNPNQQTPAPLAHVEDFVCADAVDTRLLLRATRAALLDRARDLGGEALVDEQWTCSIRGPKNGIYRVHIDYSACPALASNPDPRRPVALHKAIGVPGVMTILERQ